MSTNPQPDDLQKIPEYVKVRARTLGLSVKAYQEQDERERTHRRHSWEALLTPRKLVCVVEAKLLVTVNLEGSVDSESHASVSSFLQRVLDLAGVQSGAEINDAFEEIEVKVCGALDGGVGASFGTIKDGQLFRRAGNKQATFFLDGGD
jgi:hypothetical protein